MQLSLMIHLEHKDQIMHFPNLRLGDKTFQTEVKVFEK